jgi:hypothetical protein
VPMILLDASADPIGGGAVAESRPHDCRVLPCEALTALVAAVSCR